MRHYIPQTTQEEINNKLMNDFYKKPIINFEDDDFEGYNTFLVNFLKYFTHSDTYFKDNIVRMQGWLKLPKDVDINLEIPNCTFEFVTDNGIFIQDITLSKF